MDEESGAAYFNDPEKMKQVFLAAQVVIAVVVAFFLYRLFSRKESAFGFREADRKRRAGTGAGKDALAQARMEKKEAALRLEGIRLDRPPHELLGVTLDASPEVIQKAYRELIKRYHPDKVGPQGSREWIDSQKIAEAINHAKEVLLSRHKKH